MKVFYSNATGYAILEIPAVWEKHPRIAEIVPLFGDLLISKGDSEDYPKFVEILTHVVDFCPRDKSYEDFLYETIQRG